VSATPALAIVLLPSGSNAVVETNSEVAATPALERALVEDDPE